MSELADLVRSLLEKRAIYLGKERIQGAGGKPFVAEAEVRAFLKGGSGKTGHTSSKPSQVLAALAGDGESQRMSRLIRLGESLDLDAIEVLFIGMMVELETSPVFHQVARSLTAEPVVKGLTALSLVDLLSAGHPLHRQRLIESLLPSGALRDLALVVTIKGPTTTLRMPIFLDSRLRRYLCGEALSVLWADSDGAGLLCLEPTERDDLVVDDGALAVVKDGLRAAAHASRHFRLSVVGRDPRISLHLVRLLASAGGEPCLVVNAASWGEEQQLLQRLIKALRDARVHQAILYIEDSESLLEPSKSYLTAVLSQLASHPSPIILATANPVPSLWAKLPHLVEVRVPKPTVERQVLAMTRALGDSEQAQAVAQEVAPRFALSQTAIEAAAAQAQAQVHAMEDAAELRVPQLTQAIRRQLESRIGEFADSVPLLHSLNDLELSEEAEQAIEELIVAYSKRDLVLGQWGFSKKISNARCISGLLYGAPGTGKTMAAGIIARELGTEVFKVDLSKVVDKYIGETEKHLARIFDEAERGQVVLLFDEADSLFSQRTEVTRSTDRYANLEVNFLLQRLEHHDGIVLLTTNHEALIDPAFKRRLRYSIHFPMPEAATRTRIWQRLLPTDAPVGEPLDFEELGERYEMSGGHIKNAMLRAAYFSAEAGTGLTMKTLVAAGNAEFQAMGRVVRGEAEESLL